MKRLTAAFTFILLLLTPTLAEISCRKCEVGNCICEITDCDSGIFDVFSSTSCTLKPDYEYIFSEGYVRWSPESARSYYMKALCSDGETQSNCTLITVKAVEITTTTTRPTSTTSTTTTTLPPTQTGGPDYLLWILVVILIATLLFAVYYFFFMKKGRRKTYEELYRKWRGR
jgi:hypothetical protein